MFIRLLFTFTLLLVPYGAMSEDLQGDRPVGASWATRSPVIAQNGMVATAHPLASQIAIDVLKRGGSAVDAAIAAHAAMGLMEPMMSGIGGDMFVILWDPESKKLYGLNASGRSAKGLGFEKMVELAGDAIPSRGALAVSVPGTVDGWFELHDKFGRLEMSELLQPAIDYARNGFPVTQQIAGYWAGMNPSAPRPGFIGEFDNFRAVFRPGGRAPEEGEIFRNPKLAAAYEKIAKGGRAAFYQGEIAETIDAYMRRIGGYLRKEDLAAHSSTWIDPVSTNYRGVDVFELPPNGQGVVALQILNILEGYDIASMDRFGPDFVHVFTEAKKLAFEDRARMYADPDFYDVPIDVLLSKDRAARQRALIEMDSSRPMGGWDDSALEIGDTTYLTVADKNGMMVSFIASLASGFGSYQVPDGEGFILHNRGANYSLEIGHPNQYAPGKRPFHTIIPAFAMKDGQPWLSFGLMGGSIQPQGHAQIIINMVDYGMNVQEAGDAARIRHVGGVQPYITRDPGFSQLALETGYPGATINDLIGRGHFVRPGTWIGFGGYQMIMWNPERQTFTGATEMRKDGEVAGY